jgi:hypothetical protein
VLAPLAHVNVDVEIDLADASLLGPVRAAFVPAAIARAGIPDIGKPQASPLRQLARTFPGELPRQHDLFAAFVGADDVRTQFAHAAVIAADDLLFGEDGVAEEVIGGAGHGRKGSCYVPDSVPEVQAGIGARNYADYETALFIWI